jgi:hypothetical protein
VAERPTQTIDTLGFVHPTYTPDTSITSLSIDKT